MPFFKKRRVYKKKTIRKKSVRGGRKSSAVSSAVKTYVNRTIHRQIENKQVQTQVGLTFGNIAENSTLHVYPLTPFPNYLEIPQGVGQAQRTGNEVRVRKVLLKYVLYQTKWNPETNNGLIPIEVQLFLGFVKNSSGIIPISSDFDNLYQYNNTVNPILGSLMDLNQKINTDYWTIKKYWRHKLGYSTVFNSDAQINPTAYANYANNDFKMNIVNTIDITKHYPKVLKFNDVSITLQGAGLFFFMQALAADGTTMAGSQNPVSIEWQLDVSYEDA